MGKIESEERGQRGPRVKTNFLYNFLWFEDLWGMGKFLGVFVFGKIRGLRCCGWLVEFDANLGANLIETLDSIVDHLVSVTSGQTESCPNAIETSDRICGTCARNILL